MYQFKAIYFNCPLKKLYEDQGIEDYLDSQIKRIEEAETQIENSVMGSTTVLEKISSLGVGKFDYQRKPKIVKDDETVQDIEQDPRKIIHQKLSDA